MNNIDDMYKVDVATSYMPKTFYLIHQMQDKIVEKLNSYLDELKISKGRKDHSDKLAGRIKKGQQITMDAKHPNVIDFSKIILSLATYYENQYYSSIGKNINPTIPEINEMWSVHQFAGDYNPLHDHYSRTIRGLSIVTWTAVPKQITTYEKVFEGGKRNADGCLVLLAGTKDIFDEELMKFPQHLQVQPKVGMIIVFPKWLQHMVYPFYGKGERTSISANINMWPKNKVSSSVKEI